MRVQLFNKPFPSLPSSHRIHRRTTGGGKGGSSPPWASQGGEVPPPEDLVQSRHREISATFEIRKKSYWPYLRVLHPVDAIYIHSPSISINIGVQLGGGERGKFPRLSLSGGEVPPPEDLVQSRHSEISATFEIRKKSYWPYLCVLRPVDEIYRVSQKSCPLKK